MRLRLPPRRVIRCRFSCHRCPGFTWLAPDCPVMPDDGGYGKQSPDNDGIDAPVVPALCRFRLNCPLRVLSTDLAHCRIKNGPTGISSRRPVWIRCKPSPDGSVGWAKPLSPMRITARATARRCRRCRRWACSSMATSHSPIFGLVRHQATRVPSRAAVRYIPARVNGGNARRSTCSGPTWPTRTA